MLKVRGSAATYLILVRVGGYSASYLISAFEGTLTAIKLAGLSAPSSSLQSSKSLSFDIFSGNYLNG